MPMEWQADRGASSVPIPPRLFKLGFGTSELSKTRRRFALLGFAMTFPEQAFYIPEMLPPFRRSHAMPIF